MQNQRFLTLLIFVAAYLISGCSNEGTADAAIGGKASAEAAAHGDVIARVGDQKITFHDLNTLLNSSAVVGLSIPALGTPERDTVRIAVLDNFISPTCLKYWTAPG